MNLKELARSKGTNLKKIAEKCGVPPTTLYAISSGSTKFENVGIGTFMKIAKELGMSSDELFKSQVLYEYVRVDSSLEEERTEEEQLLDLFRSMSAEYREMLLKTATAYQSESKKFGKGMSR